MTTRYVVALYEIDLVFGGPEEGGWWVETGRLARCLRVCPTVARAVALAGRANRLLAGLQRHHRPVSSAVYAGGRHAAWGHAGSAPASFPTTMSRYE